MKIRQIATMAALLLMILALSGCSDNISNETRRTVQSGGESDISAEADGSNNKGGEDLQTISIVAGNSSFAITLYNNTAAAALLDKMPMTIKMDELNGNEKFHYFTYSLPAEAKRTGSIRSGDLMLYGSDCLVLFYESFSTSYSYTPLGYIEDANGLKDALGSGSVEVTFSR